MRCGCRAALSRIDSLTIEDESPADYNGFYIEKSAELDEKFSIKPPKRACDECWPS